MIRVLLAEDQMMVRQGLKVMIESDPEIKITGEADDGKAAIKLCEQHIYDIVILDIRMPVMDGIEAAKTIRERWPSVKILMLTTFDNDQYVLESLKLGVNGYLLKSGDTASLIRSIKSALSGGLSIEDQVAAKVMPTLLHQQSPPKKVDERLTPRERAILTCIGEGLSNQEIANRLGLSVGTIKNNTSNILNKLELRDRTQLAIYAIRHRLVDIE
ncbi:response regulator [Pseudogracilibacillus auburnensis]|uniref:response regulator n=1 Tax=Pseudogracilibacillus auburnensis TaxID=1494959 RepID=UPI001A96A8D7|nr:response regulator transcription factor [Pseudogracilibacillus auburnensis]MBO1001639.1 response regulator transcription factor [Pseudogracilibacillus auburnensis]